ncbi:MAG: Mu transposase domain-containing protein [Acidimicrobiales bacterium]
MKFDLMIPTGLSVSDLKAADEAGRAWCTEVNANEHADIVAVPNERLETERPLLGALPSLRARNGTVMTRKVDRLSCVRFGSARYSVPMAHIGRTVERQVVDDDESHS